MAHPNSRIQFPDGAGATEHQLVILPAGTDANVPAELLAALVNQFVPNAGAADEDLRLGDYSVPAGLVAGDYVVQVRTSLPATSAFSPPVAITYTVVGVPGPVTVV